MNIVKEEFEKLMGFMYDGQNISEGQKKDMERSFYAGAMAVNIAVISCQSSKTPETDIGELFDFIQTRCQELTKG